MAAAFGLAGVGIVQNGHYARSLGATDVSGTQARAERFNVV
jgi:hypothetical protein